MQDKRFYVYTLAYPESMGGRVFYVGKGSGYRINDHEEEASLKKDGNLHKTRTIKKIHASGEQIVKTKLAQFEAEKDAFQYEIALIFFMPNLTNITAGGEGASGVKPSEEARRKMSISRTGLKPSEETRKKMSATRKGVKKGKHTPEAIHKMSESHKKTIRKPLTEEHRRKISEGQKGTVFSEERRRHISEACKGRVAHNKGVPMSAEQNAKMRQALKGRKAPNKGKPGPSPSEETRRKMSEAHQRRIAKQKEQQSTKLLQALANSHVDNEVVA